MFKDSVGATGSNMASDTYGGDMLTYQRGKKLIDHAWSIERQFLLGEKAHITAADGFDKRTTGGVLEGIETSDAPVFDVGGPLTAPDLEYFLGEGFTYGNQQEKMLLCGNNVLRAINEIARGQLVTNQKDSDYGVTIRKWHSAFGEVNIISHPALVSDYAGYAMLLDMNSFAYRYMKDRDTHLRENIQARDADARVDEYLTECGLERHNMEACALIKNVL